MLYSFCCSREGSDENLRLERVWLVGRRELKTGNSDRRGLVFDIEDEDTCGRGIREIESRIAATGLSVGYEKV